MSLETTILAWTGLAAMVTLSPGPDTLLVAGHAARRGHRAGLAAAAGVVSGGVFYAALFGFGVMSILVASEPLYLAVKIAGAAYLAVIGAQMLWGALRRRQVEPSAAPKLLASPYRQGLLSNVLNPKVAVFYLAALPQFAGNGPDAPLVGVLLIAIHSLLGAAWLSTVALGVGRIGAAFRDSAAMRWLEGLAGVFLIGVAGRLAFERR